MFCDEMSQLHPTHILLYCSLCSPTLLPSFPPLSLLLSLPFSIPSLLHFHPPSLPPSFTPSFLHLLLHSLSPSLHAHYPNCQHSVMQTTLHHLSVEAAVEVSSLAVAGQYHSNVLCSEQPVPFRALCPSVLPPLQFLHSKWTTLSPHIYVFLLGAFYVLTLWCSHDNNHDIFLLCQPMCATAQRQHGP